MLNGRGAQFGADAGKERLAVIADVAEDANLHEFVRQQGNVGFVEHRRGQTMLADGDHRTQMMRSGA